MAQYPKAFDWLNQPVAALDESARVRTRERQAQLTKPPGSLGRLETLAEDFAAWQGRSLPTLETVRLSVFAADHGVAEQGVSAFSREVTAQMVANFCRGGAAVSVLGRACGAEFRVVNLGCVAQPPGHASLLDRTIAPGTADFTRAPAMTGEQLGQALSAGREQVQGWQGQLFIGGEMGIGNTTAASALQAALMNVQAEQVVGPGTGIDAETLARKCLLIERALRLHRLSASEPLRVLQCLGGFEIAALTGAYIACGQNGIPALVDGYISTAAALVACRLCPAVRGWLLFAHQSSEPGHRLLLSQLQAEPLLSLGMRLGEGSGAALAVPLLQRALDLHTQMATFSEAGVADA